MKIALVIGHGILYSNLDTSNGGYMSEYYYLKDLAPCICKELRSCGYECDIISSPEYLFKHPIEELYYKLPIINTTKSGGTNLYDLVIELHLNYSKDPFKHGICAYYNPGDRYGYELSERFCKEYSKYKFLNLGVSTPPLHILRQSNPTAIAIELFYSTSKLDVKLSKLYGLKKMATIFVEALNDGPYTGDDVFIRNIHGWYTDDGGTKYYEQSIQYINEVHYIDGDYYYFNEDGYVSNGWKYINENVYYFNTDNNSMTIDCIKTIDGVDYEFDTNGKLISNVEIELTKESNSNCNISNTVVVYDDNCPMSDIRKITELYPSYFIIKKSDYENYNLRFSEVIRYIGGE